MDLNNTFALLAHMYSKDGADISASLTPEKCHQLHMALGVPGEAGGAPILAYSSGPTAKIAGIGVIDSTLFISVGEA